MKSATAKRILNFIIIAAILISGMCFEHVEADSLFVHAVNENHEVVLTSAKDIPVQQTICTNEMSGTQRLECSEVQLRRSNQKSAVRTGTALSSLEILPKNPILYKAMVMETVDNQPSGKEVIIAYIHHQDGAKGSF